MASYRKETEEIMDNKVVDTKDKTLKSEEALITEAKERFRLADDYERENRKEAIDDLQMPEHGGRPLIGLEDERAMRLYLASLRQEGRMNVARPWTRRTPDGMIGTL